MFKYSNCDKLGNVGNKLVDGYAVRYMAPTGSLNMRLDRFVSDSLSLVEESLMS